MSKKLTKRQIANNKFKKDFQRAIDKGSFIYLQDKTVQRKAKKILGYNQDMLNLLVETARDKDITRNETRFKQRKEKIVKKQKQKERQNIVKNLNKLDLTHESKQAIISDTTLDLLKFVGKSDAENKIRESLVNKMNDLLFGSGTGKGILKGAFTRQLDKKLIDEFTSEIEKFIMTNENAVMRVSDFYENIDKYFEFIYEENMVEKGFYKTGNHSVEMKYILEDLLASFKTGLKE